MIKALKQFWHFLAEDNSIWSWIANVIVAFIVIKFLVYPGLGLMLGTSHPIVAVVSGSMEHKITPDSKGNLHMCGNLYDTKTPTSYDYFWDQCGLWYEENTDITKSEFKKFRWGKNGFNTGDIMVLISAKNIKLGDTIVFQSNSRPEPIIHRVVKIQQSDGKTFYQTKGDHNAASNTDEMLIPEDSLIGKAAIRIPWLGWVKLIFVKVIMSIGG